MIPHLSRLHAMSDLHQEKLDQFLREAHQVTSESIVAGRNITAGYTRGWGLNFGGLASELKRNFIYQESATLASQRTFLLEHNLMNLFLIMKYGLEGISGDIIQFGSCAGGAAIFMANVARHFGFPGTIYSVDTFEGIYAVDEQLDFYSIGDFADTSFESLQSYVENIGFKNLVFLKGPMIEVATALLSKVKHIALAHIDYYTYCIVKQASSLVLPYLHPAGGYLIFDNPLSPSCLGTYRAVEEMVQEQGLRAEQAYPQLVYRFPKMNR